MHLHIAGAALAVALLALAYRIRGGAIPLGSTQAARCVWALAVGLLALAYADAPAWACALTGTAGWLTMIISGHGDHTDMGRSSAGGSLDGQVGETLTAWWPAYAMADPLRVRELSDALALTWIGFVRGLLLAAPTATFDPAFALALLAGSSLQGAAYWLGWRVPWTLPALHARGPEWGELLTGGFIGVAGVAPTLLS